MGLNEFCNTCQQLFSAKLLHLDPNPKHSARKHGTHVWMFESTGDADTRMDRRFPPSITPAHITHNVRKLSQSDWHYFFTQNHDADSVPDFVKKTSVGGEYSLSFLHSLWEESDNGMLQFHTEHANKSIFVHHTVDDLERSAAAGCHLCTVISSYSPRTKFEQWEAGPESVGSTCGIPTLTIGNTCSPEDFPHDYQWVPFSSTNWQKPYISSQLTMFWIRADTADCLQSTVSLDPLSYTNISNEDIIHERLVSLTSNIHPNLNATRFNSKSDHMAIAGVPHSDQINDKSAPSILSSSDATLHGVRLTTLHKLRSWIETCERGHVACLARLEHKLSSQFFQPTRLLEFSQHHHVFKIRLVELDSMPREKPALRYATLSHCWGVRGPTVRLTQLNQKEFASDIPLDILPRTFRDAVKITAALKLRYLWIDALCIVQDLRSSWEAEAPHMMSIYSRAVVNLAATMSEDSSQGMLGQDYTKTTCTFDLSCSGSWIPKTKFSASPSGFTFHNTVNLAHLNTRGWVFQERMLSPRIIHFAEDQLWWECGEVLECENWPLDPTGMMRLNPYQKFTQASWHQLVVEYTDTALTEISDRLVAFAGIAQCFAATKRLETSDYAAGLWISNMKSQLLWYCPGEMTGYRRYRTSAATMTGIGPNRRDTNGIYVAPTWSWASVKGRVEFSDIPRRLKREIMWREGLEILEARTESTIVNLFGPVNSGYLLAKFSLHRFEIVPNNESPIIRIGCEEYVTKYPDPDSLRKPPLASFYNDANVSFPISHPLHYTEQTYFLPISKFREDIGDPVFHYEGLVLQRKKDGRGTYQRLGYLDVIYETLATPAWWTTGEKLGESEYLERYPHQLYKIKIV